ncbi:cation diffusion facilitator family transporter [Ectobacillus ponti]|uniref:Cation diffusion facilitator family transporter n=1 Tax=Ectobacillus ponti TaxID=2961894 RepID=A0AA42BN21_9BACI|nr:cation diffusion facilitator family transporter [Ectobacillus ponti]MCP8967212.1 cation diffusion facilitator family transporter [Ectobacillus ponti]
MENKRERIAKQVAWLSIISNIVLTVGKIGIGLYAGSEGVVADGIHSAADVFASAIVLLVIGMANKPADLEHPYGHGKAEVIISGIVGVLLGAVSFYIVYEAVSGFWHPLEAPTIVAMWVALFSYAAKLMLYRYSLNVATKYSSKAIEAIAYDHKADIVASLAAAAGVLLSILGKRLDITALLYGDKIASIFVAYLIFRIAKEMCTEAFDILLERSVDSQVLEGYKAVVQQFPEVKRIDRIRAREHGHYVLVDLRISIDHDRTIKEGHDLGREIKRALMETYNEVNEVLIHLNPYFPE